MQITKTFRLTFSAIIFCFLLSSCSNAQTKKPIKNSEVLKETQTSNSGVNNLLKKQVLLTNEAQFTKNRTLEGASGFLIKHNGTNFAVTVSHLLGEAGGVEPEVQVVDLVKSLTKWEMMPRVVTNAARETVKLSADGLDFSRSTADIVLLKVVSNNFEIEVLTPNFEIPTEGETLYIIGCPYIEDKCRQNSYPVEFLGLEENLLVGETNTKVNLSGFSGAPLVNGKGEVVGALVGGGSSDGKNYVSATPIREIRKIKF